MVQVADVEIAGGGYMVAPEKGAYVRMSDGEPEGRTGRVVVNKFFGGQRQAVQLVQDRSWDGEGVGPAMNGQGVEPWPRTTSHADGVIAAAAKGTRMSSAIAGGFAWATGGRFLYKSIALTAGAWASMLSDEDWGVGIQSTDMCAHGADFLAVAFGAGKDIVYYNCSTGAPTTLRAGKKAKCVGSYGGYVIYGGQSGVDLGIDNGTNQDARTLDSTPVRMALHAGKLAIATRNGSLYLFGGKWDSVAAKWVGEPEPLFTHGIYADDQDFQFLISFGGKLYTWLQGQVMEYNPNAGASRQGWRATGLDGRACYGATVAAGMLVVAITNRSGGDSELWAWDGSGWWMVNQAAPTRCWPMFIAGAGGLDLLCFRDGSATYDLYGMSYRNATDHNFNASGQWWSSLLDAGEPDKFKAWRKIGASFAAPQDRGNPASVDSVDVAVACSIDGGVSILSSQTVSVNNPTTRIRDIEKGLSSAQAVSRYIQIKVDWSSVSDWAPTLVAVWAEYELLGSPVKRRRWRLKVSPRDKTVRRDSSIDSRTGRQQVNDLWGAWSTGATVTFKDLDFDDTAVTYNARVVGISEEIARPQDQGRWGDSVVTLTLVEI